MTNRDPGILSASAHGVLEAPRVRNGLVLLRRSRHSPRHKGSAQGEFDRHGHIPRRLARLLHCRDTHALGAEELRDQARPAYLAAGPRMLRDSVIPRAEESIGKVEKVVV